MLVLSHVKKGNLLEYFFMLSLHWQVIPVLNHLNMEIIKFSTLTYEMKPVCTHLI